MANVYIFLTGDMLPELRPGSKLDIYVGFRAVAVPGGTVVQQNALIKGVPLATLATVGDHTQALVNAIRDDVAALGHTVISVTDPAGKTWVPS